MGRRPASRAVARRRAGSPLGRADEDRELETADGLGIADGPVDVVALARGEASPAGTCPTVHRPPARSVTSGAVWSAASRPSVGPPNHSLSFRQPRAPAYFCRRHRRHGGEQADQHDQPGGMTQDQTRKSSGAHGSASARPPAGPRRRERRPAAADGGGQDEGAESAPRRAHSGQASRGTRVPNRVRPRCRPSRSLPPHEPDRERRSLPWRRQQRLRPRLELDPQREPRA